MRKKKQKWYVGAMSVAVVLFGYAASMGAPNTLLGNASDMLANATVGASASVAPNPYNTLAAQLSEKEAQLTNREKELMVREQANTGIPASPSSDLPMYSLLLSLFLTLLVAANFYYDWRRGRKQDPDASARVVVNMRTRG